MYRRRRQRFPSVSTAYENSMTRCGHGLHAETMHRYLTLCSTRFYLFRGHINKLRAGTMPRYLTFCKHTVLRIIYSEA